MCSRVVAGLADKRARDHSGDAMVAGILEQIYTSLVKMQEQAITSYRSAVESRHEHLRKMAPEWRGLHQLVGQTKKNVTELVKRSQTPKQI